MKIRDREPCETPHVTVLRRVRAWRISLRDLTFLDRSPPPRDVPREVLAAIAQGLGVLRAAWNEMYPRNPV